MVVCQQTVNYSVLANFNLVQSDNLLSDSLILRHSELCIAARWQFTELQDSVAQRLISAFSFWQLSPTQCHLL